MSDIYGVEIVGYGDNPIMIDHNGLLQTWADTVIENIDNGFPVIVKFYLSEKVSYVRQIRLNLRFEHFRAYDRATDSMESIVTTEEPAGTHRHEVYFDITGGPTNIDPGSSSYTTYTDLAQTDGGVWHQHKFTTVHQQHSDYDHTHTDLDYSYIHESVDSHYHDSDGHTHPMEQGIWEDSALNPSDVTVEINGIDIGEEFKNTVEDVKIPKEELVYGWNTLEIKSKSLGRISASYFLQVFMSV